MRAQTSSRPDWRDAAAYAPLLGADRSLFAWEWLRRDPSYQEAARDWAGSSASRDAGLSRASRFGLIRFEAPELSVPDARPLWRADAWPRVLSVAPAAGCGAQDRFDLECLAEVATVVAAQGSEHLLLCDGLRAIRLDGPASTFTSGPTGLRYRIEGLVSARPLLVTLGQLLALCSTGRFSRPLHPRQPRARRWILMLRAADALADGAGQRQIAEQLLSRSAASPCWRSREPSIRSQAQRLVRSARAFAAGGYWSFLR